MISFNNDYTELAHQRLLNKIIETNMEYDKPYGFDSYSDKAEKLIREKLRNNNVDVHFISGGTQTNVVAISSALYHFESVVATDISHINAHETGALEATGHKIYTFPHVNGKLDLEAVKTFFNYAQNNEYIAAPKLICITNATEFGTYYSKAELKEIYDFCKSNDLYLFIDGARMASALSAKGNDVSYEDLCNLCDMFYLGGTKNGAMLGEALVLVNDKLKKNYKCAIKQRGAMLAKGKVMSVQFYELFVDGLYEELAEHANKKADELRAVFKSNNIELYLESETNQVFAILENSLISELEKEFVFSVDEKIDDNRMLTRFVACWATTSESIEILNDKIKSIKA